MTSHVVVDAANVVGSRPDGWWRDRPAAARRFAGQLVAALTDGPERLAGALDVEHPVRVHLVLEGEARVPDAPSHPDLTVVAAPADGDAAIVALTPRAGPRHAGGDGRPRPARARRRPGRPDDRAVGALGLLGLLTP
jgi:hypothetical protein